MEPRQEATIAEAGGVLPALRAVATRHGLDLLAGRLHEAQTLAHEDLAACAAEFSRLPSDGGPVARAAVELVGLGGKRLRPLCVALSARTGRGFGAAGRHLAVAADYTHSATLLHDDVVDLGDTRRGAPTARMVYGNAASVFAGDYLLVAALRQVRLSGVAGALEALLETLDEMIGAESQQLALRGKVRGDRATYLAVAQGKTAALFGWCCRVGALVGGADEQKAAALEAYGRHLGLAFQVVDDLLDFEGQPEKTGKTLFADLREGKPTFPLIVALEREPGLLPLLERAVTDSGTDPALAQAVLAGLARTGALDEGRRFAAAQVERAIGFLEQLPDSSARVALEALARATTSRGS